MQRALAGLAKLTIAGCRTTWQGAGGLWAEVNRRDQLFLQESHRTAIILELRREAVDREVLGAQAMWRAREARAARRARATEEAEATAVAAGAAPAAASGAPAAPAAPALEYAAPAADPDPLKTLLVTALRVQESTIQVRRREGERESVRIGDTLV